MKSELKTSEGDTYKAVKIITVGKVGGSSFLRPVETKVPLATHTYSTMDLRESASYDKNTLIISGIRNPIHRNLSYFLDTYHRDNMIPTECWQNKYAGEYCYIGMDKFKLLNMANSAIVQKFLFKFENHMTFNYWLLELCEYSEILRKPFDKEAGYTLYKLENGNALLFYTFEKLKENSKLLSKYLGIPKLEHTNKRTGFEAEKYGFIKKKLKYPFKRYLLDTPIMRHFYSRKGLELFRQAS